MQYDLEELIKTFEKHAVEADYFREKNIQRFKEEYPNDEMPEHYKNDFNICRAFITMVTEIQNLKNSK